MAVENGGGKVAFVNLAICSLKRKGKLLVNICYTEWKIDGLELCKVIIRSWRRGEWSGVNCQ